MKDSIYPCIWFDGHARDAMQFYCAIFEDARIIADTPMVVRAQIEGQLFMGLNGGPEFKPNPSISFMVICRTAEEAERYWSKMKDGAQVLMALDHYPWSDKYGWLQDKFGVNWQIYLGKGEPVQQKIVPTLMYCDAQQGKAEEAINFYTSIFRKTESQGILKYPDGPMAGQVQHAQFVLNDYVLMAMDSGVLQNFSFTEGISLVLECATQEEIDHYWTSFTEQGAESMCGWCKDPFGVSWQIIPKQLSQLMAEPGKANRVMAEIMKMKKLDLATLVNA